MSESDEVRIKKEIGQISNTIDSILKKIEQERQKLQPPPAAGDLEEGDDPPNNDNHPKSTPSVETSEKST